MTLALWTVGIFITFAAAHELNYFPQNFVVISRDQQEPVKLTCGDLSDTDVTWKLNGKDIEDSFEDYLERDGTTLTVTEFDDPLLGEYSCWSGGRNISSTYLLMEAEKNSQTDPVKCRAKSYDCNFTCTWTLDGYTAVRLRLEHDSCEDATSCQWVGDSTPTPDGTFHFELSHSLSPYAEESTMLVVTAEAIADFFILRTTKRFYLRGIIQPDSPQIVKCEEMPQALNVTIDPPATWSTPHSFFTLEHEIEYISKDNGEHGFSSSTLVPKRISRVRGRSRDSLVDSNWSVWSPWKNVKTEGNLCACKNTTGHCCPELPPEYFNRCKEKGKKKEKKKGNRQRNKNNSQP
ncbi:interleukin-12 subunit beta isoform X2 [Sphaeramia orbicularis]|uniref:interleukin-12 subunit beta isoform X2 n=1 Tax=Sphaeramia orbicularis TaxID=375764 RepID=UPI00117C8BE8|nr:interleukin-12 subunit beta-like isoform X2 [Sphaeramia orbicularis]